MAAVSVNLSIHSHNKHTVGKFGRSIRLIPATKSLGYSTRISEGDKEDSTYCKNQKYAQGSSETNVGSTEAALLPSSFSSNSLVPLSVRDMALVLMPRLEVEGASSHHPFDELEPFMSAAKTVLLTSDDIVPDSVVGPNIDKSLILERFVVDMQHLTNYSKDYDKQSVLKSDDKFCRDSFLLPPQFEVNERCKFTDDFEKDCRVGNGVDTLFMSGTRLPTLFDGFSFCSHVGDDDRKEKSSSKKPKNGPSAEQLHSVKDKLGRLVALTFSSRYDYSLLHKNVVFENYLFGENRLQRGHTMYALELLKLRLKIHARFSSTVMEVLNTTVHEDTGVIRVHWRLKGLPQTEMLKFWRLFQGREEINKDDWQWFEAFSYFHIGKDGLIHKHRIDRMLPGNDEPDNLSLKLRKLLNPAKPLVS